VPDTDLHRDLERLREAYHHKLPGKLAQLDALLRGAREVHEKGPLEAARDLTHMLKGTSGSYGFDAISAELRRIEERLDHLLGETSADRTTVWNEIEHALSQARERLGAPTRG